MIRARSRPIGGLALAVLSVVIVGALLATSASARPGDLDPQFGDNGTLTIEGGTLLPGGQAFAVNWRGDDVAAIESGVVVSGNVSPFPAEPEGGAVVLKLGADGSIDRSFGDNGTALIGVRDGFSRRNSVAVQPDGRIVVAMRVSFFADANETMVLARLLPNGTPDPSFGDQGVAQTGLRLGVGFTLDLALAPDGRIMVAAKGSPNGLLVARFSSDGTLDPSFSGDGSEVLAVRGGGEAAALALRPDGRILVAGRSHGVARKSRAVVAQLEPEGGLDGFFGDGGVVQRRFGRRGGALISDIALTPAGKVLAAATRRGEEGNERAVVARLRRDGGTDASFSNDGVWKSRPAEGNKATLLNTLELHDGRALAAGTLRKSFLVRRFRASGKPDRSFGNAGRATTGFGGGRAEISALALPPAGNLVAIGTRSITTGGGRSFDSDLAAAGYLLR